jgi:pescadillo protein
MGKRLKRGKQGNAAMYVTRNQAIKKLQLPLSQFRRLCILKGIHPREPKKKPQGSNKTYYHVKDINWLLHEPILQVLRDVKAHSKKVRKARAKQNERLAKRLMRLKPGYRLDHLVKERYPTFVDALRDLDDALTLVHLFAALPADSRRNVPRPVVETARRLATEWAAYVAKSGALRRVFVSVKGYYYQAEVMGQTVTWLQPHALQQVLPDDVDVRVLLTFEEFYATLLQFVLFRLYRGELGMAYPPVLDERLEKAAAGLAALMRDIADAQQATVAQRAAAEAGGGGGGVGGGGKAGGGDAPDVVQRIGTLAARIKQIEEEQEEGGKQEEGGSGSGSEEDEEDDEIDSGAEEEQEGKEEADGGSDDDDEAEEEEQDDKQQPEAAAADADAATTLTATAAAAGGALAVDPDDDAAVCASLLRGRVVFISRECPREPLLLVVRAFGGVAAWEGEGSPHPAGDPAITHAIVDRPLASVAGVAGGPGKGKFAATTQLVQPQWVFDSANFRVLMPERLYAPGQAPPPHLSPFVDPEEEGYTPEFYATVRKLQVREKRLVLPGWL